MTKKKLKEVWAVCFIDGGLPDGFELFSSIERAREFKKQQEELFRIRPGNEDDDPGLTILPLFVDKPVDLVLKEDDDESK